MHIREINPALRPADLAAILPAARTVLGEQLRGFPPLSESQLRLWCLPDWNAHVAVFAAFDTPEATVADALSITEWEDDSNPDLLSTCVWVAPHARRRGLGSALFAEVLRLSTELKRPRVVTNASDAVPVEALITARGGRCVETVTRSVLDLRAVSRAQLEAAADATPKNSDYHLVRWTDRCPEEFLDSFCAAMDTMSDAPMGDMVYERAPHDRARLRGREELSIQAGVRRHVLAAVTATSQIGGFTIFSSAPDGPQSLDIWDTAVTREHRGLGLGLRLKAAQTLWMLDEFPATEWVQTFNNADNQHMLDVNRALGYQASEQWTWFEFSNPALG
ncbi:GNAT family N-acetyltransferase [Kitasatospora kifunensis]|uniref:GNAT superfamily N-acetyltransferase n=1 Tax=Kitasatospora kifunensis TaxID=58351 RepID=A0A7W7R8S3_KITKI|nr:GNAT family N-acetyltransferase [Kitasatospora kifunensis]MBB4927365.1 GNAT superfamily N-acetyltransferase [Kitasatospora kifunensis]